MRVRSSLTAFVAFVFLSSSDLHASDLTVDQAQGPGTDHVSIQGAIVAAEVGDRIFVRAGTYAPFVVRKGVHVQAIGDVDVMGPVQVVAVPADQPVVLAGLSAEELWIRAPAPVAVMDCVVHETLDISLSADVRFHRVSCSGPFVSPRIRFSSFEFVECDFLGRKGADDPCGAEFGEPGLNVESQAFGRVARSTIKGGRGGAAWPDSCFSSCATYQALGGPGIHLENGGVVVSGRDTDELWGGYEGVAPACFFSGYREGIVARFGVARLSGVMDNGVLGNFTTVLRPDDPDVSIGLSGTPAPGASIALEIDGRPGSSVELLYGRAVAPIPILAGALVDVSRPSIQVLRVAALSPLGPDGRQSVPLTIPPSWPVGTLIWFQVRADDAAVPGAALYSNSIPLLVQ